MSRLIFYRQSLSDFTIVFPLGTDLSGKTPKMEIRKESDNSIVLTLQGSTLVITDNIVTGRISTLSSDDIEAGRYITDLALMELGETTRTPPFCLEFRDYETNTLW